MIFLFFGKVFQMYLNTLLKYLYFVFTSIAGKYFVFVFKYIWRVFCPSLAVSLFIKRAGHVIKVVLCNPLPLQKV